MITTRTRVGVAAAVLATGLLMTACGNDSGSSSSSPAASSAGSSASAGGASSASVDGKALDAKFTTTCAEQGGLLALALHETGNATYGDLAVSATLTSGDAVQAVGFAGTKGGSNGMPYALGYGQGVPGGSAKVSKDGNTYTVTGEGVGAPDMANPTAGPATQKFEVVFACSTVVGG